MKKNNLFKNLIIVMLVLAMVLSMTACGGVSAGNATQKAYTKLAYEYLKQIYGDSSTSFEKVAYLYVYETPTNIEKPEHPETIVFENIVAKVCFKYFDGSSEVISSENEEATGQVSATVFIDDKNQTFCYIYVPKEYAKTLADEEAAKSEEYKDNDTMREMYASFIYQDILNMNDAYIPTDEVLASDWTKLSIAHLL